MSITFMSQRFFHVRSLVALALAVLAAGILLVGAPRAEAAAYPIAVYAPKKLGATQVQGWANLSRNCSGTYGCYNYIKVERSRWYGAEFVNGWWANANGWNSITGTLGAGCYSYRTTTDSYNDVAGSYGSGVNLGPVGATSNGTKINRFRTSWSSGWTRICR